MEKAVEILIFLAYNYTARYICSSLFNFRKVNKHQFPITIIDTIVYKSSFDTNRFVDRHFPGILNFNTTKENESIFYMAYYYRIYNFISLFRNMKRVDDNFIVPEEYLLPSD